MLSVPADAFVDVAVVTSLTLDSGANFVDVGGIEVLNTIPVSVDWNNLWVWALASADSLRLLVRASRLTSDD